MRSTSCSVGAISTMCVAGAANAAMITFTHSGIGSGTIGGSRFAASSFTITATADTLNRVSPDTGIFAIAHSTAEIRIAAVGTYSFVSSTRTFVNRIARTVGLSRGPIAGSDLFNGPSPVEIFATWNMLSSIGPVSGPGRLVQWGHNPIVVTNGGELIFDTNGNVATTFTAVVPAPGSAAILTMVAGVALRRRR